MGGVWLENGFGMEIIKSHRELRVYQKAFSAAMEIHELSKSFPKEETYSLSDQIIPKRQRDIENIIVSWFW